MAPTQQAPAGRYREGHPWRHMPAAELVRTLLRPGWVRAAQWMLLATLVVLGSGCLASRQGAMVFPARYDVAPVMMTREPGNARSGMHMAAALSWASVSPKPTNSLDVAVGYQLESYAQPQVAGADGAVARSAIESTPDQQPDGTVMHGPTIELGYRIYGSRHRRVWLAGRGELLRQRVLGDSRSGMGGVLRLSGELFSAGTSAHHVGVLALGSFIELGVRELPTGKTAVVGLTGLSVRLPLAAFD